MSTAARSSVIPWDQLPNPRQIPTVSEQLRNLGPSGQRTGVNSKNRLTAQVGRDWLGVAIEKSDTVVVNYGRSLLPAKVLEIYLEDSKGFGYSDQSRGPAFVAHRPSGELYELKSERFLNRRPDDPYYRYFLAEIDGAWLGTSVGFREGAFRIRSKPVLPRDYELVGLQGTKLKVEYPDGRTAYAHSYTVSVLGDHLADPGLFESYRLAQTPPLTGRRVDI